MVRVVYYMYNVIYLPKLNKLTPTLESTLLKAVEEAGELARAVLKLSPGEQQLLQEVAGELMDVAQVCVTMLFVMEDCHSVNVWQLIDRHLTKLTAKGYIFESAAAYQIRTSGNFKYICLPRLVLPEVDLLTTVCKILEELGELTQYLGKLAGASGEKRALNAQAVIDGCSLELLDVAQCCFTMMYILAEKYDLAVSPLVETHIAKLRRKGYCS